MSEQRQWDVEMEKRVEAIEKRLDEVQPTPMPETRKLAARYLFAAEPVTLRDLARAILADTSPASQERDDLERIAEMADVSPAHCGDPEVLKVLHGIRDELRALARLRSGTEPGDVEVNPYRNGWTGEAAARPSGGEGAPEPDGWVPVSPKGPLWSLAGSPCDEVVGYGYPVHGVYIDRLPPEREAEAREPDAYVEARLWADFKRGGFIAPHGGPPLDRARRDDFENDNLPVFVGTPGPDREAEIQKSVHQVAELVTRGLAADEAEIRADERRKVEAEYEPADDLVDWVRADQTRKVLEALTMGATYAEILARLSPTDEQESPNRSDEP